MNRQGITRMVAVLTGAAVLFGLEQGLGLQLYFAIPLAAVAYLATLVGLGLVLGVEPGTKPSK
jgi:flagellar biosynthesis protein FliR